MGNLKINWRGAALLFGGWTLVSVIFAAVSYAAAIGENNKEFGFVSALRLNLVQFYLWAILSPVIFRFSQRPRRLLPRLFRAKSLVNHSDLAVRDFAAETLKEIETFKISEDSYGYVFYVLQRSN